jgi:translation initiation factor 2D
LGSLLIVGQIKPHAPLRSSDRRKIAQRIIKDLSYALPPSNASEEASGEVAVRNLLLPDGSSAAKFATTHGPDLAPVNGTIYLGIHLDDGSERPLWVRVDRSEPELFPSVYTLWKNPTLLPVLLTHSSVIERLCDGADLMIPGLIGPPFPGGCTAGSLVGIASTDRPTVAVAVGVCEVDVSRLQKAVGEKGRAVRVLHWVGDEIYKHGGNPRKVPEEIEVPGLDAEVGEVVESAKEMVVSKEKVGESRDTVEEEFRELETPEIDDAFYNAMLYGLQDFSTSTKISSLEFPMSSSVFIATLVHPYLPPASHFPPHNLLQNQGPHPSLQLKKSSWKSAAKFLKSLEKKGLAKTKTRGGGETVIMELNWGHGDVVQFVSYKLPSTAPKEAPSGGNVEEKKGGMVKVEALFRPNGKGIKFFKECKVGWGVPFLISCWHQ